MKVTRFDLDLTKTYEYFLRSIGNKNLLSRKISESINFEKQGQFFTVLPIDTEIKNIYQFEHGGMTKSLQEDVSSILLKRLKNTRGASCIFDDALEGYKKVRGYKLFVDCGIHHFDEVYYVFSSKDKINSDLILEGLRASDTGWHCLGVLTFFDFNKMKNKIFSESEIAQVVDNIELIITTAYDGEGYIFWEKTKKKTSKKSKIRNSNKLIRKKGKKSKAPTIH